MGLFWWGTDVNTFRIRSDLLFCVVCFLLFCFVFMCVCVKKLKQLFGNFLFSLFDILVAEERCIFVALITRAHGGFLFRWWRWIFVFCVNSRSTWLYQYTTRIITCAGNQLWLYWNWNVRFSWSRVWHWCHQFLNHIVQCLLIFQLVQRNILEQ